jgi:hypothetical protein
MVGYCHVKAAEASSDFGNKIEKIMKNLVLLKSYNGINSDII